MSEFVTIRMIDEATAVIRSISKKKPKIGLILGSGLGDLAESVSPADYIHYSKIPNWPQSTIQGHKGRLVIGDLGDQSVLIMQGRAHYYEGYPMVMVGFPIRVMIRLGVEVLIVTGGGAGSIRTLPLLDYDMIRKNPKPIIGFSDTTALQLGVYSKTGLNSYTGFTCRDVAEKETLDPLIENSLKNCLLRKNYCITQGNTVNSGQVSAPLIGGNLMCLVNLMGTPYAPNFKDKIFLFEEVWAEPYVVDGLLSQLWLADVFDEVAGVIIGNFTNCESKIFPDRDGDIDDVINDWVKKIKVPCIKNFPYGHSDSRYVIPIGQVITLNATQCKLDVIFDD